MGPLDEILPDAWLGSPTLADLIGSAADALGAGTGRSLPIPDSDTVVVLLVDGLGDVLLQQNSVFAPTLMQHRSMAIRAGFPSTTATSLTSLGTGAGPGRHGILGYSFAPRDLDPSAAHTLNTLRWTLDSAGGPDATGLFPPDRIQPLPSLFDLLAREGTTVTNVLPGAFRGSGLTVAAYGTPADYRDASGPAEVTAVVRELLAERTAGPRLVYAYLADLDAAGHRWGPASPEWRERLRLVDECVRELARALPPRATLVVTGDHGMIGAGPHIDVDTTAELTAGTRAIAGEARVRHVYADPGAAAAVAARWSAVLGEDAHVARREEVLAGGWFGTDVSPAVSARIGDVVAVARRDVLVTRSIAEPFETRMPGHHGGWTAAELLVPLIVATG